MWGARASPRAEVITQKRTKLPESRFRCAMSRVIFVGQDAFGNGVPRKPGRRESVVGSCAS